MIPEAIKEAERTILAQAIRQRNDVSLDHLRESDFSDPLHRRVYRHITSVWNNRHVVADNAVPENMQMSLPQGAAESEHAFYSEVAAFLDSPDYSIGRVEHDRRLVLEYAASRDFLVACQEAAKSLAQPEMRELERALALVQEAISQAEDRLYRDFDARPIRSLLEAVIGDMNDLIERRYTEPSNLPSSTDGMTTGVASLDRIMAGLHKPSMVILAGRSDIGKTSLAVSIASNAAVEKKAVLFIKANLSARVVTRKILSCQSGIPMDRLEDTDLNDDDWMQMTAGLGKLNDVALYVMGEVVSFLQIEEQTRNIRRRHGKLDLIVMDDIGQMTNVLNHGQPEIDTHWVLTKLKCLAEKADTCIIVTETVSDMWGTGKTAQDELARDLIRVGHQVIVLEDKGQAVAGDAREVSVNVAKNLFGRTGCTSISFNPACCRFEDRDSQSI